MRKRFHNATDKSSSHEQCRRRGHGGRSSCCGSSRCGSCSRNSSRVVVVVVMAQVEVEVILLVLVVPIVLAVRVEVEVVVVVVVVVV